MKKSSYLLITLYFLFFNTLLLASDNNPALDNESIVKTPGDIYEAVVKIPNSDYMVVGTTDGMLHLIDSKNKREIISKNWPKPLSGPIVTKPIIKYEKGNIILYVSDLFSVSKINLSKNAKTQWQTPINISTNLDLISSKTSDAIVAGNTIIDAKTGKVIKKLKELPVSVTDIDKDGYKDIVTIEKKGATKIVKAINIFNNSSDSVILNDTDNVLIKDNKIIAVSNDSKINIVDFTEKKVKESFPLPKNAITSQIKLTDINNDGKTDILIPSINENNLSINICSNDKKIKQLININLKNSQTNELPASFKVIQTDKGPKILILTTKATHSVMRLYNQDGTLLIKKEYPRLVSGSVISISTDNNNLKITIPLRATMDDFARLIDTNITYKKAPQILFLTKQIWFKRKSK